MTLQLMDAMIATDATTRAQRLNLE